jgi:phage regulator Rha-like protein
MSTSTPLSPTVLPAEPQTLVSIELRIQFIRGLRVIVDADLAELFGVPTKALNQAIKRNVARFPADFMFHLSAEEKLEVVTNCDHLQKLKYSKVLPFAFTEHGAMMAAMVLNSPRAMDVSVYVVRAFVRLREAAMQHKDLAERLSSLEEKTEALTMSHDTFSRNTKAQLKQVFDALRELMTPPPVPVLPKRPIGFITPSP